MTCMRVRPAPISAQRAIRIAAFAVLAIPSVAAASLLIWPDPSAGDLRGTSHEITVTAGDTGLSTSPGDIAGAAPGGTPAGWGSNAHRETTTGTGGTTCRPAGVTKPLPRYVDEVSFLLSRIGAVKEVLAPSRFYPGTYEVDAANPTSMIVLADTREHADNLDGYFQLGVDLDGETWGNAPLALGLARLYTETGRDRAFADGSFCSDGLDRLLGEALAAILGDAYNPGMLAFILEEYRKGMEVRILSDGPGRTGYRAVAPFPGWDVVFNDGYVTLVEFYPASSPLKP